MYDILGIFKNLEPKMTPVKEDVKTETTYENVEPRGSIMEAVKTLEEKYMGFKKTVAAIAKGGSAEDPEAVAAAVGRKKYGKKKFQKAAAAGKKLGEEAKPDFLDLDDDGDTDEPMKDAAADAEPDETDKSKAAKRKRLQALKDKREEEEADDWFGGKDHKSSTRKVKGKAYGGSAQKDDEEKDLDEVAPPGAKAERMVKHIKKGYAKDGKLSKREKGIAYATAWKARKKGQVEEGTKFGDTITNSKAELKKAKPAMVKESRMLQEGDYFYEKVAKSLAEKNPTLNTADPSFVAAVRKEMVAQGIEPNRARNIIMTDEDFISDVATSYGHYCKEVAESSNFFHNPNVPDHEQLPAPPEEVNVELDEIARLAGLPVKETEVYNEVNTEESPDTMDEGAGSAVSINGKPVNVSSIEVDGVNSWDRPDFVDAYITYAEFMDGTLLSDDELVQLEQEHGDLVNQAAHDSLQGSSDFMDEGNAFTGKLAQTKKGEKFELDGKEYTDNSNLGKSALEEEEMGEGNEFSGALANARASGAKEFEVDGKKYTVKEDVNINISANGEHDAMNLIRKLAGMQPMVAVQSPESEVRDVELTQMEEERDIEYTNTPREETAGVDAAIPAGADLNRAKKQYKKEYPGDNPMAVKEEQLWKSYEKLISELKG